MGCVVQRIQRILQSEDSELPTRAMSRSKVSPQQTLVNTLEAAALPSQYLKAELAHVWLPAEAFQSTATQAAMCLIHLLCY